MEKPLVSVNTDICYDGRFLVPKTNTENGEVDFYYHHINNQNQLRVGKCHSIPRILDNGKLELAEKWQWLNGDKSEGESVIIEQ